MASASSSSGPSIVTSDPSRRRVSPTASSPTRDVLSSMDRTRPTTALVKHGKYVLAGGAGCWWVGLPEAMERVLEREKGWVRRILMAAIALHGSTIVIFLYLVLFLPWFRGYIPNYPRWQQSARLRVLVPFLTATILLGWTSYVVSLSQAGKGTALGALGDAVKGVGNANMEMMDGGKGMGLLSAMAGATALYTLTIGILGFIPPPSQAPTGKKQA